MPELPEVENIKFGLEEVVINKQILDVKYSNVVTESHKLNKMAIVKQDINFFSENVIFELSTGEKLVYSDIRRFGELRYIEDVTKFKPFVNLAPEPFDKKAKKYFLDKLDENKYKDQSIKALLLEGNVFCGCGNIYDCEVLYRQKIHPLTKASELSKKKKESLFKELVDILDFRLCTCWWWRRKYAEFPPDLW